MKVALVYDRVNKIGGAERILSVLHEIWPEAPLYTSVCSLQTAPWAKVFPKVIPSFLQKFPFSTRHELYASFMPLAFESFAFDEYDVVISITTEAAKGIITKPKTLHICYCLTPTRYLWSHYDDYFRGPSIGARKVGLLAQIERGERRLKGGFFRWLTKPVVAYLRTWDKIASQRPDYYLAISENVKKRIKKYYGRESKVIYPPVLLGASTNNFFGFRFSRDESSNVASTPRRSQGKHSKIGQPPPHSNISLNPTPYTLHPTPFFLIVSRLVPYKRIDLAIEAFNDLGLPLKIVGTGSEMGKLKRMAKSNIEFLGELTDDALLRYYQGCQALIFPQDEDLGLTPIEVQACGRPVIAFRGGGALETVIPGKTGEFFYPQTSRALKNVIVKFDASKYKADNCRNNVERFSVSIFKEKLRKTLEQYL